MVCCLDGTTFHAAEAMYSVLTSDTSQATAIPTTITNQGFVTVRGDGTNWYGATFTVNSGGNWTSGNIYKSGVTFLGNFSGSWSQATTHTLNIVASVTTTVTLTVYVDGVSAGSATDSTSPLPAGGHPGLMVVTGDPTLGWRLWQDY